MTTGSVAGRVNEGIEVTASLTAKVRVRSSRRAFMQLGIGMAVIVGAISFLAFEGLSNALVYYITPSQLLQRGRTDIGLQLRLGGQVRPGSLAYDPSTHVVRFVLQDPRHGVRVVSSASAVPPPMLHSGGGAVVQGIYRGGVFRASSIMVKHDSDYVAPKPGQLPGNDNYAHK